MSFQTPITVKEAIENIRAKKYLLPSIQRELVWYPEQIEKLFDSLMRDYPVGSFLFWHVDKSRIGEFTFYEFIRNYHVRDSKHNVKADLLGDNDITAILDGQQRLTSLYIGLLGSYAEKEKAKRWSNDLAFPAKFLHLNLLKKYSDEEDLDLDYDFYFLTEKEAQEQREKNPQDYFWFRVGEILKFAKPHEINAYLIRNGLMSLPADRAEFASETLFKLFSVIHEEKIINFFLEKHGELDKVLNIFVRINSGGTPLSYSDLLLSIASASWQKRDAREEITGFVDEISESGEGFNFTKDFVLKTCLVLCDFPNIAFKVDNFNKANMQIIEQNWSDVTDSLRLTVNLVESFGYKRETLISNNALIPIAYYLRKKGNPTNFVDSRHYQEDREKIKKWLISSLLKRAFSGVPDNTIRPIRQIISKNNDSFPLQEVVAEFRGKDKSIIFTNDDIEALFDNYYGSAYTFSTLAVLYPTLDFKNKFHIDHIFPKSLFTRKNLLKRGINEEKVYDFIENVDYLPNLQLLEGIPNIEKSNKDFKEWLSETYPNPQARKEYMEKNYIPDMDFSIENFDEFLFKRTALMAQRFSELLRL
jgi:uncharacterized protein with ParB-like and HNH nuclease domain